MNSSLGFVERSIRFPEYSLGVPLNWTMIMYVEGLIHELIGGVCFIFLR